MYNFAVFILTHGRADNVKTIRTLLKQGYTGRIVLILDNLDKDFNKYKLNYSNLEFYVFNKDMAIEKTDSANNKRNPAAVVYARNMTHQIAKELGIDYFLVLDDDYSSFLYTSDPENKFKRSVIVNLDKIFYIFLNFLKNTSADSIAFAQGGDFIGGSEGSYAKNILLSRKCMNSFFCKTDRAFQFYGLINEDVNMYVLNGSRGKLYFTSSLVQLCQEMTQQSAGGLTDIYLEQGTYLKSFYSVMYHPSSVVIKDMGMSHRRLHHYIKSELTYPKIISEKFKK